MDAPKPPFHSVTDELLYSIYLKLQTEMAALTPTDLSTLAKLNALLTDADVASIVNLNNAINGLKGNPPEAGNTLEKLYGIIQGLNYLSAEDIDTLSELNAILGDADLVRATELATAVSGLKGNVPDMGNTLEKLYNLIQGLNYLSADDIDTLGELNAILGDADIVRTVELTEAINLLKGNVPESGNTLQKLYNLIPDSSKLRSVQFRFDSNQNSYEMLLFKGQIHTLSHDFTNSLSSVAYKSRLDTSDSWVQHANLAALQNWITSNISGDETTGTKYWIKCIASYKQGKNGEAVNLFYYQINVG